MLLVALLVLPSAGRANPEPVALYDARSAAMGGTGIALLQNASAAFHDPAALGGLRGLSAVLTLTPMLAYVRAPFAPPGGTGPALEEDNEPTPAPLFFLGVAGRLSERWVAGLGAYVFSGIGSTFPRVRALGDERMELGFAAGELSLPVAFRLAEGLHVGLAARLLYATQRTDVYDPTLLARARQQLDGLSGPAFTLALHYQPRRDVRLAVVWRGRATIPLEGSTELRWPGSEPVDAPTRSSWTIPHALRLGGAWDLGRRWTLALETKVQWHRSANAESVYEVELPGLGVQEQRVPLRWRNTVAYLAGLEYRPSDRLALRAGYGQATSATPPSTVSPFMPPPGLLHQATLGAGWRAGPYDVGLALALGVGQADVERANPNGAAGRYEVRAVFLSASIAYASASVERYSGRRQPAPVTQ